MLEKEKEKEKKRIFNCIAILLKNNLLELPYNELNFDNFIKENLNKIKIFIAIRTIDLLLKYKKFYFDDIEHLMKSYKKLSKRIKNKILRKILMNKIPFINFQIANNIVKNYIKNNELEWIFENYIRFQMRKNKRFVFSENKMLISLNSILINYFNNYDFVDKNNNYINALDKIVDFIIDKIAYKIFANNKNIEIIFAGINSNKNYNIAVNNDNKKSDYIDINTEYKNYLNGLFKIALINNIFSNLISDFGIENFEIYFEIENKLLNKNFDNIYQLNKELYDVFNKYYNNLTQIDIFDFTRDTITHFNEIIDDINENNKVEFEFMEFNDYNIIKDTSQNKIIIFTIIGKNNISYKIKDINKFQKMIIEDLIKYDSYYEITKYSLGDIIKNTKLLIDSLKI